MSSSEEKKPTVVPAAGIAKGDGDDAALGAAAILRVCESDFALLVKVSFFKVDGNDDETKVPRDLELHLSTDVTAKEVKQEIAQRRKIDPAAQLLLRSDGDEAVRVYAGRILRSAPPSPPLAEAAGGEAAPAAAAAKISTADLRLRCRVQPPDPRLLSLYAAASLGDVWERDELLQKMTAGRPARCCPAGHPLAVPAIPTDDRGRALRATEDSRNRCARCHWWEQAGSHSTSGNIVLKLCECRVPKCEHADFALCTACLERHDKDGRPAEEDPPAKLLETALSIMRQRAGIAAWFGGKGHMCGIPSIRVETEYAPRELQLNRRSRETNPLQTGRDRIVVHPGARLLVRLSDRLRALLPEDTHSQYTLDRVLDDDDKGGVALGEIVELRCMLRGTEHWSALREALQDEFPTYRTERGTLPDAYEKLALVSYGVEEVVFERDVMVDDGDY